MLKKTLFTWFHKHKKRKDKRNTEQNWQHLIASEIKKGASETLICV